MLQITLELKNNADENLDFNSQIVQQGVDVVNFNGFLQTFNDSRKDRDLPWRQNHA